MCSHSVILLLCILCTSFASIVKFLPTTSFNLPINFKDGKLPCSRDTVIFPETMAVPLKLESETFVNDFILPNEGDIIFDEGVITLGPDVFDYNCTQGRNVYYLEKTATQWWQSDIWSSEKFNDATPDAERVPCFDDIVEFPKINEFVLLLPDLEQSVARIKLGNNIFSNTEEFMAYISQPNLDETFVRNNFLNSGLRIKQESCFSKAGCPCQKYPLNINCAAKYCSLPKCVDPVKPDGHCCKICGGVLVFEIDDSFDMSLFKLLVEKTLESYSENSLIYHVGRLPSNKIQLVVVEKGDYSGLSSQAVNAIDHQMKSHWVRGAKYVNTSGGPLNETGIGGKIFVSVFFVVAFFMGGVYVYYYKLAEISSVRFPILHRNTPRVFSRFQSRTDSVVCLTRRDSDTRIGESAGTDFRNPLYDSTGQQLEVQETASID